MGARRVNVIHLPDWPAIRDARAAYRARWGVEAAVALVNPADAAGQDIPGTRAAANIRPNTVWVGAGEVTP